MKGLGFTRKKFLSLTQDSRRRHLISWLSENYQILAAGRTTHDGFLEFVRQFKMACNWAGMACPKPPDILNNRDRLAYISDAVHRLRTQSCVPIRDYDLLERVVTGDRDRPPVSARPVMAFQVALDGLRSLFNVGSIFRTCEAAGIETIILGNCLGKQSPQVRKTSMGAHNQIKEVHTKDLAGLLTTLKTQGYTIVAVETVKHSMPCHEFKWPQKTVLVMGNEEYGISSHVLRCADHCVHIPMFGKKNSLNVANALATVLYQAVFYHMRT